jgi:phage tail protein X
MDLFGAQAIDLQGLYDMLPPFADKQQTLERMLGTQQATTEIPPGLADFAQSLPPEAQQQIMSLPDNNSRVQALMQAYEQVKGAPPT